MKNLIAVCFLVFSFGAIAAEVITVVGESRYPQVFRPSAENLASDRLARAESYAHAARKIANVCQGEDYEILKENVTSKNGGGVVNITTSLEILCENPIFVIDI